MDKGKKNLNNESLKKASGGQYWYDSDIGQFLIDNDLSSKIIGAAEDEKKAVFRDLEENYDGRIEHYRKIGRLNDRGSGKVKNKDKIIKACEEYIDDLTAKMM